MSVYLLIDELDYTCTRVINYESLVWRICTQICQN